MPIWLVWTLLIIFLVHLIAFARLAARRRTPRYILITLTFALLVAAFSLRLGAPEFAVAGVPLHSILRRVAWVSAALTITMLIVSRLRKRGLESR